METVLKVETQKYMRIAFFNLESWEKEYLITSEELIDLKTELVFVDQILDKDRIPKDTDFEIISVFVDSVIDEKVLERFPDLKFVSTRSTGYDHIDLGACRKRNILVSNVPYYGENTVAEYTFTLILALSRKVYESYRRIKETGSFNLEGLRGFDLQGKTLGVLGTGRIGRNVIRIAKGFEMKVIAYDVHPDDELSKSMNFKYMSLEDVLKNSDIITLHVPYLKETHHLINQKNIGLMKKGAYLINTCRGDIVETEALIEALKNRSLAGAALDVLEEEGVIKYELDFLISGYLKGHDLKTVLANHILINMPNVIITPHNAFNTWEGIQRILGTTLENIKGFIKNSPVNLVK